MVRTYTVDSKLSMRKVIYVARLGVVSCMLKLSYVILRLSAHSFVSLYAGVGLRSEVCAILDLTVAVHRRREKPKNWKMRNSAPCGSYPVTRIDYK